MSRVDDDTLSLHLEVTLSTVAPSLLDDLIDSDRRRRHAAIAELARQLVERLRCFDICGEEAVFTRSPHPALFPGDICPIG